MLQNTPSIARRVLEYDIGSYSGSSINKFFTFPTIVSGHKKLSSFTAAGPRGTYTRLLFSSEEPISFFNLIIP